MKPAAVNGNVQADCPTCGVPTTFEFRAPGGAEFGQLTVVEDHTYGNREFERIVHKLLRCSVCHAPAVATFHSHKTFVDGVLSEFWPTASVPVRFPPGVPRGVVAEFREAEKCLSAGAYRAAAAMFRSALEKVLKANGYDSKAERDLYRRIEAAANDGVITSARRQRAQDLVRTLGNDVLHDEWRPVTVEEAENAQHYVGRVIEDLYDDRASVEKVLALAKRFPSPTDTE